MFSHFPHLQSAASRWGKLLPSPSVQEPPRVVSAVRDLLSSDSIYAAPLLLQSTGDHRAALRSRRAQGTISLPCTSRACCTSSSVEGAAPRDLVWPLGWRCCRARRLSSRVGSCLHQEVFICWRRRGLNKSLPSQSVVWLTPLVRPRPQSVRHVDRTSKRPCVVTAFSPGIPPHDAAAGRD